MQNILLLEDDEALGTVTKRSLEKRGFEVSWLKALEEVYNAIPSREFHLAILDLKLKDDTSLRLIPDLRQHYPEIKILMLTAFASIATAVEAIKLGADNYLPKPATVTDIIAALGQNTTSPESAELPVMSTRRLEWEHIQRVLLKNDGNISATARELNMHRRTLQRKLQKKPVKE